MDEVTVQPQSQQQSTPSNAPVKQETTKKSRSIGKILLIIFLVLIFIVTSTILSLRLFIENGIGAKLLGAEDAGLLGFYIVVPVGIALIPVFTFIKIKIALKGINLLKDENQSTRTMGWLILFAEFIAIILLIFFSFSI